MQTPVGQATSYAQPLSQAPQYPSVAQYGRQSSQDNRQNNYGGQLSRDISSNSYSLPSNSYHHQTTLNYNTNSQPSYHHRMDSLRSMNNPYGTLANRNIQNSYSNYQNHQSSNMYTNPLPMDRQEIVSSPFRQIFPRYQNIRSDGSNYQMNSIY
ncbi:hypothetical protein SNEBB_000669 [Seison nebaliae]|nr:hypothetical protein SNEBB_000669 [Seison nebaliae]